MAAGNASWAAGVRAFARGAWVDFAREEAASWEHALRATAGAVLALWIALRLDLGSPYNAALTAMMVSLPQAGLSLAKSLARLVGTLAGAVAGLLLVVAFAQLRDLFVVAMAAWVGACIAGSAWYRHTQAYAWVLAGYTGTIVGFAAYQQPDQTFYIAVDRITVVSIGVICGGVLNAVAFPRASRDVLVRTVRAAFRDFVWHVASSFTGAGRQSETERTEQAEQRLVRDVVRLDAARFSTALEDPELTSTGRLDGFISGFMIGSTTAHAVAQLRADLARRGLPDVLAALTPATDLLLSALHGPGALPPTRAAEAVPVVERLASLGERWGALADAARARLPSGAPPEDRLELDSALALARQLLRDARELARRYVELPAPSRAGGRLPRKPFRRRPDPLSAAAAGLRAAATLLAICAFWIVSGWPDGSYAATAAAVGCGIFAASARPVHAAGREIFGYVLGLVGALVLATFVLPAMEGFPLLVAGLTPFLLFAGYLTSRPSTATLGWPYLAMLLTSVRITGVQHHDVEAVINPILANMFGLVAVSVSFAVLLPAEGRWRAARLERALTREVRAALTSRRENLRHRFEAAVRDLTLQLADLPGADAGERRRRVLHGIRVLEAGHAVIALRVRRERASLREWVPVIDAALRQATRAFEALTPEEADRALVELRSLRGRVDAVAVTSPRASLVGLRTSVWLLDLAVVEHAAALAAVARAPDTLEVAHAA